MELHYILLIFLFGIFGGFVLNRVLFNKKKQVSLLEEEISKLHIEAATIKNNLSHACGIQEKLEKELHEERQNKLQLTSKLSALLVQKEHLEEKLRTHKTEIEGVQIHFQKEFENLANRILEEKSEKFTSQNQKQIGQILTPLKDNIELFKKRIEENNNESIRQNSSLQEQIKMLRELNQQITKEAENLTKALKGDNKAQGNWGEIILERILERSGLMKDREYFVQQNLSLNDGRRFRPDVVIKLPEEKSIVIDSKVSLLAYERYCSSEEKKTQEIHLKDHLSSLKNHIRGLGEKRYQDLPGLKGLDFILLFIPVEPAFLLAMQKDQELFNDAYERNILIVSPSTLIASLKIISATWKHEYQNNNAMEIARQGGELYNKFVGFTEDLLKIGNGLNQVQGVYDSALKKLSEGRGNLISRATNLKNLGVKTSKELDGELTKKALMENTPKRIDK